MIRAMLVATTLAVMANRPALPRSLQALQACAVSVAKCSPWFPLPSPLITVVSGNSASAGVAHGFCLWCVGLPNSEKTTHQVVGRRGMAKD